MRKRSASERPIWRARRPSCGEQRDTSTEMKTILSIPSTISSAVSVTSAAQAFGSVRSSSMVSATSLYFSQQPRPQKVSGDDTQCAGDPWVWHHVADDCDKSERRPNGKERDVKSAQAHDAKRMQE